MIGAFLRRPRVPGGIGGGLGISNVTHVVKYASMNAAATCGTIALP
jgi:hypothetical protein